MTDGYAFSNSSPHADDQLAALEAYLDPVTTRVLSAVELPVGARCLEIGAGAGSIAFWLAARVAPAGQVLAVDADTSRLAATGGVRVRQQDIRAGLPDGPFDLIHARLVLLHLPQRRQLLRELAAALAPGGWLVVGELSGQPLSVLTASSDRDREVFARVVDGLRRVLAAAGADLEWAHQVHPAMVAAGLTDVHTIEHAESWTGGGAGARLHHSNSRQKEVDLLAAGVTRAELARFRELTADPRFAARSWQFVCTRGRKLGSDRPT